MAMPEERTQRLVHVASLEALLTKGRHLFKEGGKRIAVFAGDGGVYACNNRCPHEGYPLMEGKLTPDPKGRDCILTCNWHNWKFDLAGGETLVGGDRLRRYPVEIIDGEVWVDVSDPAPEAVAAAALDSLRESFHRHEYDRMAREISRLQKAGADPLAALRGAFAWTADRFEFGCTHAQGGAADWLALRDDYAVSDEERLVPLIEVVGHLAWDSLREPAHPYPPGCRAYDPAALVAAIEAEDEAAAVALVRGALAAGLAYRDLEEALAEAALAHYQDFGHALIYTLKTGELIDRLGPQSAEPLLLSLVRSLVYATREDLIPEFRAYASAVAAWDGAGTAPVAAADLLGLPVSKLLARVNASSGDRRALYDALIGAASWQFLHYDTTLMAAVDKPVSHNVTWLDFSHAITFGNAVRALCGRYPRLWPRGLLQIACFVGRNAGFVDKDFDGTPWRVENAGAFLDAALKGLLDHGQAEYIVSIHHVKLLSAVKAEVAAAPEAPWAADLLAAANRFVNAPFKRKHALRSAHQALGFVAAEG
ncbi:MAG: Rieske (2Fe-2S) protein [Kiloniellaceae bacterium]